MKKRNLKMIFAVGLSTLTLVGCQRSSCEVWEDSKTCGRYVKKGMRSLFGRHIDQEEYALWCESQKENPTNAPFGTPFVTVGENESYSSIGFEEFESSSNPSSQSALSMAHLEIDAFRAPQGALSMIFQNLHFETDNYSIKGSENFDILTKIARYLSNHPETYIYVEGHADERGAAAYNLALGSRRANAVRTFLADNGCRPEQLRTISYGKERPLVSGSGENIWQQNRRVEFKIYEK